MCRNTDTVPISAVQLIAFGKSLGIRADAFKTALAEVYASSKRQTSVVGHSDPRVQYIRNRLDELDLSIPQELLAVPENPDPQQFTRLVYIDPAIPIADLVAAIEVNGKSLTNYLDLSKIKDVVEAPQMSSFVWMQDGHLYKGKSPNQARKMFSSNERGATVREGLFLILYYPEILKDHFIDLPGSRCARSRVPCLDGWFGGPRLCAGGAGLALSRFGSASCGSIS